MATQAHCAYCFESLSSSLEKRPALTLRQVEALWKKYSSGATTLSPPADVTTPSEDDAPSDTAYKPAAIARVLATSPSASTGSSLNASARASTSSTPVSGVSETSSATSKSSSSFFSRLRRAEEEREAVDDHPLFVTWNTVARGGERRLRGCIGTFEAVELDEGLKSYALTSAFDDTRFTPITPRELPSLDVAVTLLTDFEPAASPLDWTIGTHGLRISFTYHNRRYGSTYLPDVAREQGWTKEETLVSLMRKAGWSGRKEDWKKVDLAVVRYQGRKISLGWGEWREWRSWVEEEMADC